MPDPEPAPVVEPAYITARFVRPVGGVLSLEINTSKLRAYLDALGVGIENGRYIDQPPSDGSGWVNTYDHRIRPNALLKVPENGGDTIVYRLSDAYRGPVNKATLQSIAESIAPAVQTLLDWFQPVMVTVKVIMKNGN